MNTAPFNSAPLNTRPRSKRFQYRYTVAAAAREICIPSSWVWFWLYAGHLLARNWLRCLWVRLEDVQTLFRDRKAVEDAFYATGEPLLDPEATQDAVTRWPDLHREICVSLPPKKPPVRVKSRTRRLA